MELLILLTTTVIFVWIVVVWGMRFMHETGIDYQKNRFGKWCSKKERWEGEVFQPKSACIVFGMALFVRILFYILGIVLCIRTGNYDGGFGWDEFLDSWKRWDALHYINLADMGYKGYEENGQHLFLVFFPLYPWMLRMLHVIIHRWEVAALFLSTFAFCVGSVFFYGVIQEEFGKKMAGRAWLLLVCYPFSFFFGGMMTESLFFCLMSAGFFYIRRHRWLIAGMIGAFCAMCRIQGILLLGVGLVEFCVTYRPIEMLREKRGVMFVKAFFTKGIFLFLTLIGNGVYFWLNKSVEGDWMRFRIYQKEHWYHTTTWVSKCLDEIIGYLSPDTEYEMLIYVWIPELVLFVVTMCLLLYAVRRYPLRYSAFLLVYVILNYSVTFLISGGRYMACALPAFLFLAGMAGRKKLLYPMLLIVSVSCMVFYFYGYMSGQQVL